MAWLDGFDKRIKITIDSTQITSSLSNFPVPIYLSASSGQDNDDVSDVFDELITVSGTKKIAITTDDGETQCYTEIERWDWGNEKAWLHTKIPTIVSGTDTEFYLYYDSAQADNTTYVGDVGSTPALSVWDSNFKAVYHLGEDPAGGSGCVKDSTSNANNGTPSGMIAGDLVDGQFGKALDFDGSDDEIDCQSDSSLDNITLKTVEFIIDPNTHGEDGSGRVVSKESLTSGWNILTQSSTVKYVQKTTVTTGKWTIPFTIGDTQHYALSYDRDNLTTAPIMYLDGVSQTVTEDVAPTGSVSSDAGNNFSIGNRVDGQAGAFDGIIDEVRMSDVFRPVSWIKATYEGLWDNLLTFAEEDIPPVFCYEGYITVESVPAACIINLYKRDTGELIDSTTSSGSSGYFKVSSSYDDYHFVVALPGLTENYAILTDDKIHPSGGN